MKAVLSGRRQHGATGQQAYQADEGMTRTHHARAEDA
jgi:hypothetical protein